MTRRPFASDGAIFDFDGVIIDSRRAVRTAVNEALAAHGAPTQPGAVLDRFIGPPVLAAFSVLLGEPETSSAVLACADTYHERYERIYLEHTTLVPGVAEVLDRLTLPLALATAKQIEFTLPLLAHLGLEHSFRAVCAPSLTRMAEDKSLTVARAVDELGVRAPVVVGDRSYDVAAAQRNGLAAIGVTWGIGNRAELAGADVIVERPEELLEVLTG